MSDRKEGGPYFFLSLSFFRGWERESVSTAAFFLLKVFISSSRSLRFSSTFLFSSWCMRFSCSNFSCSCDSGGPRRRWGLKNGTTRHSKWGRRTRDWPLSPFPSALLPSLSLCSRTFVAFLLLCAGGPPRILSSWPRTSPEGWREERSECVEDGQETTALPWCPSWPRTWRARCQGLYLWSPSPPACSVGTARSGGRGSAPWGPPC